MNMFEAIESLRKKRWQIAKTDADERILKLKKLKKVIEDRRVEIAKALYMDFRKPESETELTEIHSVLDEINHTVKKLAKWMQRKRVGTPITLIGARSYIQYEARGICLIIAPWNYPFQLALNPLVAAIAAGNVCVLKPSEKTPNTSLIIEKIIKECFAPDEVLTVLGGVEVSKMLLDMPFDHIFFTGSTAVGKIVMEKAAKHLTSVTLELGGKSPVIVDESADLDMAADRIMWGKFVNAGQTCVAPDYVFVHEKVKTAFLEKCKIAISRAYGETDDQRERSDSFARLVDDGAFKRLRGHLDDCQNQGGTFLIGGVHSEADRYLAPTILSDINDQMTIMNEEVFGPLLPVKTYTNLDYVINYIQTHDKPLALYLFTNNSEIEKRILSETTSGGIVINQVLIHFANANLPFGGVGSSGMGNYHGEFGFRAFSHARAVLKQGKFALIGLYFPPYGTMLSKIAFRLLRLFQ